jgi:hypothetical protein
MKPLDLLPNAGPLPKENQKKFWDEYLLTNWKVIQRFQQILKRNTILAGLGEEGNPNVATTTVDLVLEQGTHNEVDNPLDREPVGIIPLIAPGVVRPRWSMYTATVNVTADSTAVTTSDVFSTDIALGYLIAQSSKAKILSRDSTTALTLYEPWPGATDTNINASIMYKWDATSVWLYCGGTVGWPGLYRLMFF